MIEIAIYVEGGGETGQQRAELRQGFDGLLIIEKTAARVKRLGWKVVPSGGRDETFKAFINAVRRTKRDTINVLLVDSEEEIAAETSNAVHLVQRDGWDLSGIHPERVHLMVQCMEAWIVADSDALARYYGQGFAQNALPRRTKLEEEPKESLLEALVTATRSTQKGEYAKIKHAGKLMQIIDPDKVADRCLHFRALRNWLKEVIAAV